MPRYDSRYNASAATIRKWNVMVNGKWVGTVEGETYYAAVDAAKLKFGENGRMTITAQI